MIRPLQFSLAFAILAACSDEPFTPTVANMAGSYHTTTLRVTDSTGTTDYLAIGSSITLQLDTSGAVSGHLLIIGGSDDPGGGDLEGDLSGTWALTGRTITFDQPEDTFIRDWDFHAGPGWFGNTQSDPSGKVTATVVFAR